MHTHTKPLALLLSALQIVCSVPFATAEDRIALLANDTIAGVGTHIDITGTVIGEPLVVVLPPYGSEILAQAQATDSGLSAIIPGSELQDAGTYEVSLELDGSPTDVKTTFIVEADTVDPSQSILQSDKEFIQADGSDSVTVDVILRDRFGNTVSNRPVQLISGRATDRITAQSFETDDTGKQSFSVSAVQPGPITLRALDLISGKVLDSQLEIGTGLLSASAGGSAYMPAAGADARYFPSSYASPFVGNLLGAAPAYVQPMPAVMAPAMPAATLYGSADASARTQNAYEFAEQQDAPASSWSASLLSGQKLYGQLGTFDVIDRFILETESEIKANFDENLTITAVDKNGRVVEDYTGKVLLSSTDKNAILPSFGEVSFRGSDLGQKTLVLGMRFSAPGRQLLLAQDSVDPNIRGSVVINVTGLTQGGEEGLIAVEEPKDGTLVNTDTVIVKGFGPPFVNITVTGGETDVNGDTDQEGGFALEVPLDTEKVDHTLRVRDQSGRFDSGNISIKLDVLPAEVVRVDFTPASPKEGEEVSVEVGIVEAGPAPEIVTLSFGEESKPMELSTAKEEESYAYRTVFTAPAAGDLKTKVSLTDSAGNASESMSTLTVSRRGLPKVENVLAEPGIDHIRLSWDPVKEDVDAYRIYVHENTDDDYLYTVDTDRPVTSVDVSNLQPSRQYSFRVKALESDRESEEFSEKTTASTLGMELSIVEADAQLTLEWTRLQDSIPLQNYLLEFGVDEDDLDNERMLSGDMNVFILSDLINELTYYVRVTPIAVTGEKLEDLIVTAQGTPNSAGGFALLPGEKVPPQLLGSILHSGASPLPPIETVNPPEQQPETGLPFSVWWIAAALLGFAAYFRKQRASNMKRATELWPVQPQWQPNYDIVIQPRR